MLITGETGFNLNQQMAELGIAPSRRNHLHTPRAFAGDSEQFWAAVPDGNYCAFTRTRRHASALFGAIAERI